MTDQARHFDSAAPEVANAEPADRGAPASGFAALDLIRARLSGDADGEAAAAALLHEQPGRAAGRVAAWSLKRAADMLAQQARRPVRLGAPGEQPTVPETQLLAVIAALASGDEARARQMAEFLVRPAGVPMLLERLSPAAKVLHPARLAA